MQAILVQMDLDNALFGFKNCSQLEIKRRNNEGIRKLYLKFIFWITVFKMFWRRSSSLCYGKNWNNCARRRVLLANCTWSIIFILIVWRNVRLLNLAVFKENVVDLKTFEVKYDKEGLDLTLLCLLPASYILFRNTFLFSHDTLNIEDVMMLFIQMRRWSISFEFGLMEIALFVDDSGRSKSRSNLTNKIYNYYKRNGHLVRDCLNCRIMKN